MQFSTVREGEIIKDIPMNGNNRSDIKTGTRVKVVQKQDQRSGKLTEGTVWIFSQNPPRIHTASKYACKTASSVESRRSSMPKHTPVMNWIMYRITNRKSQNGSF